MTRRNWWMCFPSKASTAPTRSLTSRSRPQTPDETFDPKALWLNAEHIRGLSVDALSARLLPVVHAAGFSITPERMQAITR